MTSVGFGVAAITPPTPVALAGFSGRAGLATEVHDELEVRAVVIDGLCLVVCDLLGMSKEFSAPVRDAVAARLGIGRAAVLTSCIHTHAGPSCIAGGEKLGWPTPAGYLAMLVAACVGAAVRARDSAVDAELRHARAPLPEGLSINRRGNPYAPWFVVVDVVGAGGERVGTVVNIAVHPVAIGRQIDVVSSDWVGVFRRSLEARAGGTVLVLPSALGDVNPPPHPTGGVEGSLEHAEQVGTALAGAVFDVLGATAALGDGADVLRTRTIEVPTSGLLAQLAGVGDRMEVELVEWRIGRATLVAVPGEAFHAMGLAIEASHDGPVLLAGLAPSWHGYLPEPFGDGYEETVSFGPDAVAGIRAALVR